MARWMRSRVAAHDGRLGAGTLDATPFARARGRARPPRVTISSSRTSSTSSARFGAARQLHDVRHERRELVELRPRCRRAGDASSAAGSRSRVLQRLDVRAQARDRRAQLVARVGHELALGLHGALQRVERRVEAAREPAELVAPGGVDAMRRVRIARQLLRPAREAADRRERRPRHQGGQRRPERRPGAPTTSSTSSTRSSWRSTSSSGRASWIAPRSGSARVSTRRCVPVDGACP